MLILLQILVIIGAVFTSSRCFEKAWSASSRERFSLWNIAAFLIPMLVLPLAGLKYGFIIPLIILANFYSEQIWERS